MYKFSRKIAHAPCQRSEEAMAVSSVTCLCNSGYVLMIPRAAPSFESVLNSISSSQLDCSK